MTNVVPLAPYRAARLLKEAGKRPGRKRAKPAPAMTAAKLSRAETLALLKARRALRESGNDPAQAAELLWAWSRQNTALKSALTRVPIGALTGFQTPPEAP